MCFFSDWCQINGGRVETQPRFKIQYPMKNRGKDAKKNLKRCTLDEIIFIIIYKNKSPAFAGLRLLYRSKLFF